ncbi:hypothetical protein GWO55_07305 [Corynebacterium macginleyi]|nr:hypothetical protein [Corynebacterium macginleyi]
MSVSMLMLSSCSRDDGNNAQEINSTEEVMDMGEKESVVASKVGVEKDLVGKIVEIEEVTADEIISVPKGAKSYKVSYGAKNAYGQPILSTGLVTLPKGTEPEKGWPILSWAHGTTGLAKKCAPSEADATHPDREALQLVAQSYLQTWLDKGFAVIQPDYEGLGTVGSGTYMDRHSLASAVNEMVRATRSEFSFADTWYNSGWSQGGFAAVSAASAADVPSGLQETFAIAPGDTQIPGGKEAADLAKNLISDADEKSVAYSAYVIRGAMNFNSDIKAEDLLSDSGRKLMEQASEKCLTSLKEENTIPGKDVFAPDANLDSLVDHLNANSMINMKPSTPVKIFISEDDEVINYDIISASAGKLADGDGTQVEVIEHKGESHRDMVRRAVEDQKPFVSALR